MQDILLSLEGVVDYLNSFLNLVVHQNLNQIGFSSFKPRLYFQADCFLFVGRDVKDFRRNAQILVLSI